MALIAEYVENEVAADAKFKGQRIRLSGNATTIGKDIMGTPYIAFRSQTYQRAVQCFFGPEHLGALASVRRGQRVVVDGTIKGLMMNVVVEDCVLVK